jgi:hypothetical protein
VMETFAGASRDAHRGLEHERPAEPRLEPQPEILAA